MQFLAVKKKRGISTEAKSASFLSLRASLWFLSTSYTQKWFYALHVQPKSPGMFIVRASRVCSCFRGHGLHRMNPLLSV